MNDQVRQTLQTIIRDYGRTVCDDPRRCKALLLDLCDGAHRGEVHVLVAALEERVVDDLLTTTPSVPLASTLARLRKRLEANCRLAPDAAAWAVESWALALGVIAAPPTRPSPPASSPPVLPQPVSQPSPPSSRLVRSPRFLRLHPIWLLLILSIFLGTGIWRWNVHERNQRDHEGSAAHENQQSTTAHTHTEAVSVGRSHTCVLLRNGEVLCYETSTWERSAVPANVGPVSQISVGFNHTCAITNSGTVRCWGSNGYGQAEVPPDLGPVSQVSAGTEGTCVLLTDGTVRCWGIRVTYQPNVPPDLGPVSQVSANVTINESGATCVVTNAGTVRCWGNISDLEEMLIPTDLGPVSQISTGGRHACTVNAQGQVRCWGSNGYGQAEVPPNLGPVSQVSAGFQHTCAVTTDGSVRCWGSDSTGQSRVPPDLGPVSQVSAGFQHTCAVTTDGAVRCWGSDAHGQLGATTPPPANPESRKKQRETRGGADALQGTHRVAESDGGSTRDLPSGSTSTTRGDLRQALADHAGNRIDPCEHRCGLDAGFRAGEGPISGNCTEIIGGVGDLAHPLCQDLDWFPYQETQSLRGPMSEVGRTLTTMRRQRRGETG